MTGVVLSVIVVCIGLLPSVMGFDPSNVQLSETQLTIVYTCTIIGVLLLCFAGVMFFFFYYQMQIGSSVEDRRAAFYSKGRDTGPVFGEQVKSPSAHHVRTKDKFTELAEVESGEGVDASKGKVAMGQVFTC